MALGYECAGDFRGNLIEERARLCGGGLAFTPGVTESDKYWKPAIVAEARAETSVEERSLAEAGGPEEDGERMAADALEEVGDFAVAPEEKTTVLLPEGKKTEPRMIGIHKRLASGGMGNGVRHGGSVPGVRGCAR